MQFKEIYLKFLQNYLELFLSFFFFFFINNQQFCDKFTKMCFSRQSPKLCLLKAAQKHISHPKSLIINYVVIWISFFWLVVPMEKCFYFKIEDYWIFRESLQICILKINISPPKSLMINYLIIWINFGGCLAGRNRILYKNCIAINLCSTKYAK